MAGPALIVDDDPKVRGLIAQLLAQAGYEPREVATAQEALAAVQSERPELAVLEVCLPDMCGYEVCRQLRDLFGEALPIVFMSGERIDAIDRVAGLLVGGDDYLVKPFAPDELLARIRALVRRATPPPSVQPAIGS